METRLRSIQEKISITATLCSTAEFEIQCGRVQPARDLLRKLHSTIDRLTEHISNPAHVSGERAEEFHRQLDHLRNRLAALQAQTDRPSKESKEF